MNKQDKIEIAGTSISRNMLERMLQTDQEGNWETIKIEIDAPEKDNEAVLACDRFIDELDKLIRKYNKHTGLSIRAKDSSNESIGAQR